MYVYLNACSGWASRCMTMKAPSKKMAFVKSFCPVLV